MLEVYWPSDDEIKHCIRTEAEELAEYVLLAVHEPMTLQRRVANSSESERKTESDLLDHVLRSERPIPIIGESGIGKSHLIRWLDAKLRMQPESEDWHIRRIPKNASLGQVLEILLEGLEGKEFESARVKIHEVGERLDTRELADHLIVFTSHRLVELWEETKNEIEEIKKSGQKPDEDTVKRIQMIQRHAKREALPALLGDTHYKKQLVDDGQCIYHIAQRLAVGSSDEELATTDYQIRVDDLDFNLHLGDLAREAREYVNSASLNTMPERRQEATGLLNEVLNDACRKAFQQLFQFHGGSFQELFSSIRRHLKEQNKTMVVLVEDMAAISAIEDVLIDSLMQEGVRDGVEELCSLRSAIAVTEGYSGYVRRRNTLATRARYEWYIDKYLSNPEETYSRIEDFCGRYLNAARHGKEALAESYDPTHVALDWPDIWHSEDLEEKGLVEAFGVSPSLHPLFPYNRPSLRALADKYCRPHQDLEFNPRKILGHILIDILSNYRAKYCIGGFPPVGFEGIDCPSTLAMELGNNVYDDLERARTAAGIWGYGAEDLQHLAGLMSPSVAQAFSLKDLFQVLDGTKPIEPIRAVDKKPDEEDKSAGKKEDIIKVDKVRQIANDVDEWFKSKSIPQKEANVIRQNLVERIQQYWKSNYSKWYGMRELPALKKGKLYLINIPYNTNNPAKTHASLGAEMDFNKSPLEYKVFIIALLRNNSMNGWDYKEGYQDYCRYMNFINKWVPDSIQLMVQEKRENVEKLIMENLTSAFVFDPGIGQRKLKEKITFLCTSQEKLKEGFVNTGIELWDKHKADVIEKWPDMQSAWLWSYATNNHALEGDLLLNALRGTGDKEVPVSTSRTAQNTQKQLVGQFSSFELLDECSEQEQFIGMLKALSDLVSALSSAGEYQGMEGNLTARKYNNRINKVMNGDYWSGVKALLLLRKPFEVKSVVRALNVLDREMVEDVDELLKTWEKLYEINKPRMEGENQMQGGDKRLEIKNHIDQMLDNTTDVLNELNGVST